MKVKVCGMTSLEQLQHLDDIGVHFAGMIFYEKSPRYVGDQLSHHKAAILKLKLKRVGVFVNDELPNIITQVKHYGLDFVQLHGDETVDFCKQVQEFVPVIKAFRVGANTHINEATKGFEEVCDFFLFDTASSGKKEEYGGTGQRFNWDVLQSANINKPFFLSGGIGLDDADAVTNFKHPQVIAVDVNSRFESSPGIKKINEIEQFLHLVSNI